jgi:hypothetical protein
MTAGDLTCRFAEEDVSALLEAVNSIRLNGYNQWTRTLLETYGTILRLRLAQEAEPRHGRQSNREQSARNWLKAPLNTNKKVAEYHF